MNLPFKERVTELNFLDVKGKGEERTNTVTGSNPDWTYKDKLINNENKTRILAEI
jgi:hypothetical protein